MQPITFIRGKQLTVIPAGPVSDGNM